MFNSCNNKVNKLVVICLLYVVYSSSLYREEERENEMNKKRTH